MGFYHKGPIDCVEQVDWFNNGLVVGGIAFFFLLIAGILLAMYFSLQKVKRQNANLKSQLYDITNDNPDPFHRGSTALSYRLGQLEKQFGEHSEKLGQHECRLKQCFDWMMTDNRKTFYILSAFAEVIRLNASRQVTLEDLARMVMDQLANDKNQSGTSGADSGMESTDGTTH
jgi:hypothetical protein